eukprot:CAMPEP_0184492606 /NCGR_PEP_ID=MMETSP0113_2-20130426/23796_1 /TAXON_ID=91329 /ORGANISM="Norrisiella sphaerica, Strain BC52" /LENGTH=218 /DNA_ID=CAMNT_0026877501 /DNA_START=85 /DNA_END=738 /DNA_ORIENTATION=-
MYVMVINPLKQTGQFSAKGGGNDCSEIEAFADEKYRHSVFHVSGSYHLFRRGFGESKVNGNGGAGEGREEERDEDEDGIILEDATCVCIICCPPQVTLNQLCHIGEVEMPHVNKAYLFDNPSTRGRMVLLIFNDPESACIFIERANGIRFDNTKAEICHAIFLKGVHVFDSTADLRSFYPLPLLSPAHITAKYQRAGPTDNTAPVTNTNTNTEHSSSS